MPFNKIWLQESLSLESPMWIKEICKDNMTHAAMRLVLRPCIWRCIALQQKTWSLWRFQRGGHHLQGKYVHAWYWHHFQGYWSRFVRRICACLILVRRPCMWPRSHPCIESHETALYDTDACIANRMIFINIGCPGIFLAQSRIHKSFNGYVSCLLLLEQLFVWMTWHCSLKPSSGVAFVCTQ